MSEEQTKEVQPTSSDVKEGDIPNSITTIDKANEAAERMERANQERLKIVEREERLAVQNRLAGSAEAGSETKPVEETPKKYADDVLAGKYNEPKKE